MLIDIAEIKIQAGKGGDGKVSFRREKFIPKGGPDGGDGGTGGSVRFIANNNMATLIDFRAKPIFKAEEGEEGGKKKMSGINGKDLDIHVPVGTQIYELREGKETLVQDLDFNGKVYMAAQGGKGGKGNWRFRSSTNQTPVQYTAGEEGETKHVKLEIKLIADIGLVGAPNAGKSTLLNHLTRSNAKVADYPFTTLSPNLGTCLLPNGKTIVISDIPGLIEGASIGKGLGDEFLRHIERTRILINIIDPMMIVESDSSKVSGYEEKENNCIESSLYSYDMLQNEMQIYGRGLLSKPSIVVINKIDVTEVAKSFKDIEKAFKSKKKVKVIGISAATGEGVDMLINEIMLLLEKFPKKQLFDVKTPVKLFSIDNLPNRKMVFKEPQVKEKQRVRY